MKNPYDKSQNTQQQIMANQQALASYQLPQRSNNMGAIMELIGSIIGNMPTDGENKKLPTPKIDGGGSKPSGNGIASVLGKIFNKNGGASISNPNTPNFMNY